MQHYAKGDYGLPPKFEGVMRHAQDNYDGDTNTVSQYDDMKHYKKNDWGFEKPFEGVMFKKSDNYDGDPNSVSEYDHMTVYPRKIPSGGEDLVQKSKHDRFDRDEDTVSPYDDGSKMEKFDWDVPAGQKGHWEPEALV